VAVITEQPDLTLEETAAELRRHRIRTSRSSLSRFFHRHDITFKKKPASEPEFLLQLPFVASDDGIASFDCIRYRHDASASCTPFRSHRAER
jgi:hypothetical protein